MGLDISHCWVRSVMGFDISYQWDTYNYGHVQLRVMAYLTDRMCTIMVFVSVQSPTVTGLDISNCVSSCPRGPPFTWGGCCGSCLRRKPTELAHSFLFCSCVYFCLCGPFHCISFQKLSRQLSTFSLYSSGLDFASSVLSTTYL